MNKREARAFILLQFGWSSRDAVLSVPLRLACETLLRVNAAFLKIFLCFSTSSSQSCCSKQDALLENMNSLDRKT